MPTIDTILFVLKSKPDSFWYEKAKTNPMIPKIRPTIGNSKPRTIDKIPKISEVFSFVVNSYYKISLNLI